MLHSKLLKDYAGGGSSRQLVPTMVGSSLNAELLDSGGRTLKVI